MAKGGGELTREQVQKAFTERGLSPTTSASTLSRCVKSGKLVRIRDGVYKIAPKK